MLEQTGVALDFLAFFTESKVGKTGLTVTADVRTRTGAAVVTGGACTEIGGGLYRYTLAAGSNTAEDMLTAVLKTATTTVDQQHIPALWCVGKAGIEDLDATISSRASGTDYTAARAAKLDLLSTGLVAVVSPVSNGGQAAEVVQGGDYTNVDGRALSWSSADWPTLTGGTAKLRINTATVLEVTASITSYTGTKALYVELTAAQTAALPVGVIRFELTATISGRVIPLVVGDLTVLRSV